MTEDAARTPLELLVNARGRLEEQWVNHAPRDYNECCIATSIWEQESTSKNANKLFRYLDNLCFEILISEEKTKYKRPFQSNVAYYNDNHTKEEILCFIDDAIDKIRNGEMP